MGGVIFFRCWPPWRCPWELYLPVWPRDTPHQPSIPFSIAKCPSYTSHPPIPPGNYRFFIYFHSKIEKLTFFLYRTGFTVTQQEASWIASLSMLGAWFGAMFGERIMRKGRRTALRVTSLPLAAAWIVTGIALCVELIYITSFVGGLCCSIITMVAQVIGFTLPLKKKKKLIRNFEKNARSTSRRSQSRIFAAACRQCSRSSATWVFYCRTSPAAT